MRPLVSAIAVAFLLFAGPAAALSINPDPVNETRGGGDPGGPLDADVNLISISGDTMTLQLSVNSGTITQIDVSMLFDSISLPTLFSFVSSASTNGATGDVGATAINVVNEAQFLMNAPVTAGQTSDELVIQFDAAIPVSWEGGITFDNGFASDQTYAVTPEPGTLMLMGFGLAGLVVRRRR
ncbi:MAG: PEP-CTERM sorting domain-containing protein [Myxococcota bacterium]